MRKAGKGSSRLAQLPAASALTARPDFGKVQAVAEIAEQPGDAVTLQASMQRGSGEMRQRSLKGIQAIVERQQGVSPDSVDDGLILGG